MTGSPGHVKPYPGIPSRAFKDERLGRRLRKLLVRMAGAVGAPIPLACQDWANTKAAYRFLSDEAVSEAEILAGHSRSTRGRVAAADGLLVLQDTTEFSYQRARPERIGAITTAPSRREADGRLRTHTSKRRLLKSEFYQAPQLVHRRIVMIHGGRQLRREIAPRTEACWLCPGQPGLHVPNAPVH